MATKSVFWPEPVIREGILSVSGDEHRHLKVSRAEIGEKVEVFDGRGRVWPGLVLSADKRATRIHVAESRLEPAPRIELILAQALIRPSAFEWVLEKDVEVGVTRIIPFRALRSNVRGGDRKSRWQRIIVEAAKQSKCYHLPRLDDVTDLETVLRMEAGSKILLAERTGVSLKSAVAGSPVLYIVGPEGGWTDGELDAAVTSGASPVHLGSNTMRAETAAVVGGALIRYEMGVL